MNLLCGAKFSKAYYEYKTRNALSLAEELKNKDKEIRYSKRQPEDIEEEYREYSDYLEDSEKNYAKLEMNIYTTFIFFMNDQYCCKEEKLSDYLNKIIEYSQNIPPIKTFDEAGVSEYGIIYGLIRETFISLLKIPDKEFAKDSLGWIIHAIGKGNAEKEREIILKYLQEYFGKCQVFDEVLLSSLKEETEWISDEIKKLYHEEEIEKAESYEKGNNLICEIIETVEGKQ